MMRSARLLCIALLALLAVPASAASPLSLPFEFRNNQIFLRAAVGHGPAMWFILDSGASGCVVDTAVARRLRLKTAGEARGTGAGKGTYALTFAADLTYRLPGVQLAVAKSYVIDLSGQTALQGRRVARILGYDFFARYVVALDFETSVMTLSDPATFQERGSGESIPFALAHNTPHIAVRIKAGPGEAVERLVLVDSGSGDGVDDDVLAAAPAHLEVVGGVGLGQEFRTTLGRAEWLQIGTFKLAGPLGATGGTPLIGLEILRRFAVVFDYAHTRLLLAPNKDFSEPFAMDASGLDLRWTPDLKRFAVHDVAKDTPAAEAGLHSGDEIVAINGTAANLFRIDQVQSLLTKDGQTVRLDIRSGAATRTTTLILRKRL
jgi:hypothetical protein